jgi:ribosomal subunit interface protein
MRIETRWRNLEPIHGVEQVIAKRAERLKRTVGRFDPERGGVELTIQVEHVSKRDLYEVSCGLHLTNHSHLFAREEGHDLFASLNEAFNELARQVRKLKSRYAATKKSASMRGEAGRPEESEEDEESYLDRDQPQGEPETSQLDREQLARLARTIHRELRFQAALHDLPEDQTSPMSVLDEAIAAALPRLQEQRSGPAADVVLIQEAMATVQRRVGELLQRASRLELSTDASVPTEEKRDRLEGAGESYLAPFLEESLHFEDLLPMDGASPEEVTATLELEERIDHLLREFPPLVRGVFLLSALEGLSAEQVGEALNLNEETVRTHLTTAREAVRKGLEPELSPALRRVLGLANHAGRSAERNPRRYSSVAKEL